MSLPATLIHCYPVTPLFFVVVVVITCEVSHITSYKTFPSSWSRAITEACADETPVLADMFVFVHSFIWMKLHLFWLYPPSILLIWRQSDWHSSLAVEKWQCPRRRAYNAAGWLIQHQASEFIIHGRPLSCVCALLCASRHKYFTCADVCVCVHELIWVHACAVWTMHCLEGLKG